MAGDMGVSDCEEADVEELMEKKILLGVLEEAMDALLPEERELVSSVGQEISVCEFARQKGENRRTLAFRKEKVLGNCVLFSGNMDLIYRFCCLTGYDRGVEWFLNIFYSFIVRFQKSVITSSRRIDFISVKFSGKE